MAKLFFDRGVKVIQWRKGSLVQMELKQLAIQRQTTKQNKKTNLDLNFTLIQKYTQTGPQI